jgi:hypothetical protein
MYTRVLFSPRKDEITSFEGKWMTLGHHVNKQISLTYKQNVTCFLLYAESRFEKDKKEEGGLFGKMKWIRPAGENGG